MIPPPARVPWYWIPVYLVVAISMLWFSVLGLLVVADWSWGFLRYVVPGGA